MDGLAISNLRLAIWLQVAANCFDLLFELTFPRIKCNRLKVKAFERLHV
jgi:hypothetical protein